MFEQSEDDQESDGESGEDVESDETTGDLIGKNGSKIGRPGRSEGVREVDTEEEIEEIFDRLSKGGTPVTDNTYPGDIVQHPDGSTVGRRPTSKSGGATIDIVLPDGTTIKVHLP